MIELDKIVGFEWDKGNACKNEKHSVSAAEAEQVFFCTPLVVNDDSSHSANEMRYHALGRTVEGRLLHISFTLRQFGTKIRIISARTMHRKKRDFYEKAT